MPLQFTRLCDGTFHSAGEGSDLIVKYRFNRPCLIGDEEVTWSVLLVLVTF